MLPKTRYHGDTIGVGSYAKVKIGYAKKYKKSVALKIIDQNRASISFLTNFLPRELQILKRIQHPNVIQFYEAFSHGAKIVIVTELAKYGDLLELIKSTGALGEKKSKILFKQIADGVQYLHFNNIVHRDLKCENILLADDLSVKIGDFGFACQIQEEQMLNTHCGSLAYSPPEVLRGIPYAGPPCDVWSMGIILYVTVCGRMPFKDKNIRKLVAAQEFKEYSFPKMKRPLTDDVKMLIGSMIEPDVEARFTIKKILDSFWLLGSEPNEKNKVEIEPSNEEFKHEQGTETDTETGTQTDDDSDKNTNTGNNIMSRSALYCKTLPHHMTTHGNTTRKRKQSQRNHVTFKSMSRSQNSSKSTLRSRKMCSLGSGCKTPFDYSHLPPPPREWLTGGLYTSTPSSKKKRTSSTPSGFSTPPLLRALAYGGREAFERELLDKRIHPLSP